MFACISAPGYGFPKPHADVFAPSSSCIRTEGTAVRAGISFQQGASTVELAKNITLFPEVRAFAIAGAFLIAILIVGLSGATHQHIHFSCAVGFADYS